MLDMDELKRLANLAQELANVAINALNGTLDQVCEGELTRTALMVSIIANMVATASVQLTAYQATPDDMLRMIHKSAQDQLNQREGTS